MGPFGAPKASISSNAKAGQVVASYQPIERGGSRNGRLAQRNHFGGLHARAALGFASAAARFIAVSPGAASISSRPQCSSPPVSRSNGRAPLIHNPLIKIPAPQPEGGNSAPFEQPEQRAVVAV